VECYPSLESIQKLVCHSKPDWIFEVVDDIVRIYRPRVGKKKDKKKDKKKKDKKKAKDDPPPSEMKAPQPKAANKKPVVPKFSQPEPQEAAPQRQGDAPFGLKMPRGSEYKKPTIKLEM